MFRQFFERRVAALRSFYRIKPDALARVPTRALRFAARAGVRVLRTALALVALLWTALSYAMLLIGTIMISVQYITPLLEWTWPANAYFGAVLTAYLLLRKRTSIWAKAASATLRPASIGFGVFTVVLVVVNGVVVRHDYDVATIRAGEFMVLRLSRALEWANGIAGVALIAALVLMLAAAACFPRASDWFGGRWKAVSRVTAGRRYLKDAVATLAVLTSFSLFTDHAMLPALRRAALAHVQAAWRASHDDEQRAIAEFLAARAVREAFQRMSDSTRQQYALLVPQLHEARDLSSDTFDELLDYMAWRTTSGARAYSSAWEDRAGQGSAADAAMPAALAERPREMLEAQQRATARVQRRAGLESQLAIEMIVKESFSLADGPATELFTQYLRHLVVRAGAAVAEIVAAYGEHATDVELERLTEPQVASLVECIEPIISRRLASARGDGDAVQRQAVELLNGEAASRVASAVPEGVGTNLEVERTRVFETEPARPEGFRSRIVRFARASWTTLEPGPARVRGPWQTEPRTPVGERVVVPIVP